jgi:hypothetical protein
MGVNLYKGLTEYKGVFPKLNSYHAYAKNGHHIIQTYNIAR